MPTAFASGSGSLTSPLTGDFFNWLQAFDNSFKSVFNKDICPRSPNTNGLHEFVQTTTTVDGKDGVYYVCRYCGDSADIVGKKVHQQQVDSLPAPGYTSDGGLLIPFIVTEHINYDTGSNPRCKNHTVSIGNGSSCIVHYLCDTNTITFSLASGKPYFYLNSIGYSLESELLCPYDGYYAIWQPKIQYSYVTPSGEKVSFVSSSGEEKVPSGLGVYYTAGSKLSCSRDFHTRDSAQLFSASFTCATPLAKFTPFPSVDPGYQSQYNIATRPAAITGGNYGIVGDNGQITTVTNHNQIINETNNTYYNPATGQTQAITDWTYNYDGRIYDITLDTGDKVSVEYGDNNITITENTVNEGDTTVNNYTIYYIVDGGENPGPSPTPGPPACPHEWYKTGERQPTCLIPAQRTYTCSICGEQKTETDPVLGHSWHAIQTVTTKYDENGNMTQEGYTIYECERCGEQYKSTNDTGPPPSGGGGSGGGSSENIFSGIFGLIWNFFTFLFDLFSEFVVGGIKGFINGLKDAGSSFFSILNPFDWGY